MVAYDYAAARQHIVCGMNGFTAPFDDREAYLDIAVRAAGGDLTSLREEARASARKVRWKKVVKRFEKQLEDLANLVPVGSAAEREPESVGAN